MEANAIANHREPWNKGKIVGQKAPFKLKDIWALRVRLQMQDRVRELALFNLGIDSKLRGCDLVSLKVRDGRTRRGPFGCPAAGSCGHTIGHQLAAPTTKGLRSQSDCRYTDNVSDSARAKSTRRSSALSRPIEKRRRCPA